MAPKIEELDKNFAIGKKAENDGRRLYDARDPRFSLRGVWYEEESGKYVRMPRARREAVSPGVAFLCTYTSGGRLLFRTDARNLSLTVDYGEVTHLPHMPLTGTTGFDLYAYEEGYGWYYIHTVIPENETTRILETPLMRLPGGMRDYCLHFPPYNTVLDLRLSLPAEAVIEPPRRYKYDLPVVIYGSSITEGACVSRPGNTYTNMLSRLVDCDHINLGFGGRAHGEEAMADHIAALPQSAFIMDYDHNGSTEELEERHEAFFLRFRAAQPDTPVLLVTAPWFSHIGKGRENGKNVAVIERTYRNALARGDRKVWFLNGAEFARIAGGDGTVDCGHPNDLGSFAMAQTIAPILKKMLMGEENHG